MAATVLITLSGWLEMLRNWLMPSQMLMLLALPLTLSLAGLEWWHFRRDNKYNFTDSMVSILMGGSYVLLAEGFMVLAVVVPAFEWVYSFRLTTLPITPWSLLLLFVLVDFCFYIFHLSAHRIRLFWAVHEVHHASEYFNFTVAFRQSLLYAVAGVYAFFLPALLLGFPPEWVLTLLAANMTLQIFVHTQWVGQLPAPIEWLFNTPSNHRVHHGRNPRYIDRNMGGVLMVWDHIFGTYAAEDPAEPPEYGVVRQIHSSNLVTLTFHELVAICRDVARPGPLGQRLKHLWGPPEWQRDGAVSSDAGAAQVSIDARRAS